MPEMEKLIKKSNSLSFLITIGLMLLSPACQNKVNQVDTNKGNLDTVYYETKNAQSVKIRHGDSTITILEYGGPNILTGVKYTRSGINSFHMSFGEEQIAYPEFISMPQSRAKLNTTVYRFNGSNGMITEIQQSTSNQFSGPYYLFGKYGILRVSGFYKNGTCTGIWHHYDDKGNILETINADLKNMDVLKYFKIMQ